MTPLIAKVSKLCPDPETYHWFDINDLLRSAGEGFNVDTSSIIGARLPYPNCCLVSAIGGSVYSIVLGQGDDPEIMVSFRRWEPEIMPWRNFFITGESDQNAPIIEIATKDSNPEAFKRARACLAQICLWYMALQSGAKAHIPTRIGTPAQQAKRARHGKAPLFEWHTVTIQPKSVKAEPQGGTHASPRQHDRRGHWRKCPSGKQVWVRNCKVGDASKGVIFKDYKVAQ